MYTHQAFGCELVVRVWWRFAPVGEGPIGLVICPSRELARQTLQVMDEYVAALREDGYPELRTLLCIGGVDMRAQVGFQGSF